MLQPQVIDLQPAPAAPPTKPGGAAARMRSGGLKPRKTSVESRSRHVGSAQVGKLKHVEASEEIDQMVRVDLVARDAARRAMVFHEIFSLPKALRQDAEM